MADNYVLWGCSSPGALWDSLCKGDFFIIAFNQYLDGSPSSLTVTTDDTFSSLTVVAEADPYGSEFSRAIYGLQTYTYSDNPLPYAYLYQDPLWFTNPFSTFPDSDFTFAQAVDFVTTQVMPFRIQLLEHLTTADIPTSGVQSKQFGTTNNGSINMSLYVVDNGFVRVDNCCWGFGFPGSDNTSKDWILVESVGPSLMQPAPSGIVIDSSGIKSATSPLVEAINSLQTNVSINHGQAIFSVQGGALTGP